MSLSILTQGRLLADPVVRTSRNGTPFVSFAISAAVEGEYTTINAVGFDADVVERMNTLTKGESVAIAGRARLSTWEGRDGTTKVGLSVVADSVLTAYAIRKRRASAKASPNQNACEGQGNFSDEEMEF
jgi:single-stranded DNA-binding protein